MTDNLFTNTDRHIFGPYEEMSRPGDLGTFFIIPSTDIAQMKNLIMNTAELAIFAHKRAEYLERSLAALVDQMDYLVDCARSGKVATITPDKVDAVQSAKQALGTRNYQISTRRTIVMTRKELSALMTRNLTKVIGAATLTLGLSGVAFGVNDIFNLSAADHPQNAKHCQQGQGRKCLDREEEAELAVHVAGGGIAACSIGLLLLCGPGRKRPSNSI